MPESDFRVQGSIWTVQFNGWSDFSWPLGWQLIQSRYDFEGIKLLTYKSYGLTLEGQKCYNK